MILERSYDMRWWKCLPLRLKHWFSAMALQIKITQGALKTYLSQGLNCRDSANLRKSPGIIIFKEIFRQISHAAGFEKHSALQLKLWFMDQMHHVIRKFVRTAESQAPTQACWTIISILTRPAADCSMHSSVKCWSEGFVIDSSLVRCLFP